MKKNNQRKGLYARDKWFNLVMYAVLFVPVIWHWGFHMLYIVRGEEYTSGSAFFEEGYFWLKLAFGVFLIFQLLRWGNYESVRFRNGYESLPITKWNRVRYDLEIGGCVILGMGIITTIFPTILLQLQTKLYLQEVKAWANAWNHPEDYQWHEFNTLFYMERDIQWGIAEQIFLFVLLVLIYEGVVLAKLVSRNVFSLVALGFPIALLICSFVFGIDAIGYKMGVDFGYGVQIPMTILLVVVFFFLLRLLVEKVDEAKGGAYLFRWAQLLTAIFWAGVAGITMVANANNGRFFVLKLIIAVLASVGVFIGVSYLTRAR